MTGSNQSVASPKNGMVDQVSRLSSSLFLFDGWAPLDGDDTGELYLESTNGARQEVKSVWFDRPDLPVNCRAFAAIISSERTHSMSTLACKKATGTVAVIHSGSAHNKAPNAVQRLIQLGRLYGPDQWHKMTTLIQGSITSDDASSNDQVFCANAVVINTQPDHFDSLLDQHLPPDSLTVDMCLVLDTTHLAIIGWGRDIDSLAALDIVLADDTRLGVLDKLTRYDRPDVSKHFSKAVGLTAGFAICVEVPPSVAANRLRLTFTSTNGFERSLEKEVTLLDPHETRRRLLTAFHACDRAEDIVPTIIAPALMALQSRLCSGVRIDREQVFGPVPKDPDVSVVVPVLDDYAYTTQQVIDFSNDPELANTELIFVLQRPTKSEAFLTLIADLCELYGLSCRALVLNKMAGRATALNVAGGVAAGHYLLLCSEHVLPKTPGWLSRLVDAHKAEANIGAVSPKLLYEDNAIDYAGISFERGEDSWLARTNMQGMHRSFRGASNNGTVDAITSDCALINKQLYREFGGLDEGYITELYQHTDLSLKVADAGRDNYYVGSIELYHIVDPSTQANSAVDCQRLASCHDAWRQTNRWAAAIEQISETVLG